MPKYRKKPVVIEAFQMTEERRQDNSEWPNWLNQAWQTPHDKEGSIYPVNYPESDGTDKLRITTLEGDQLVGWDDFIIQGVRGEIYPCKPDIFEATYDLVETFNSTEACAAQAKYCNLKDYPHFAPPNGICYSCHSDIYTQKPKGKFISGISVESAGKSHVTGCPHCHRSYCD